MNREDVIASICCCVDVSILLRGTKVNREEVVRGVEEVSNFEEPSDNFELFSELDAEFSPSYFYF